jgi:hypothetical protein
MSKARSLVFCLFCVFVVGAVNAASAAALTPEWWIQGKVLTAEEKIAEQPKIVKALTMTDKLLTVECPSVKVVNGVVKPNNKNTIKALVFEGCTVVGDANCEVPTFDTNPLVFPLEDPTGEKGKIKLNFRPETGNTLAVVTIVSKKGVTCIFAGKSELRSGEEAGMVCEYPEVEKERVEHELQFTKTSGSKVKLGGEEATFLGEIGFRLPSGKEWSARV